MKFRTFRKQEDGAVAVIVALAMTVLLGMTAFAVDYGMMAACKQSMQNAVDAAALAAAAELCDKRLSAITPTAKEYCALNGYDPDDEDVTMEVGTTSQTVTVTLHQELPMGFSTVLTGRTRRTVSAAATAEGVNLFADCPYAIFADRQIRDNGTGISVYGNDHPTVTGSLHSNSNISFAAVHVEGGTVTACGNIDPPIVDGQPRADKKDMPSLELFENAVKDIPNVVEFPGDYILSGQSCFKVLLNDAYDAYRKAGYDVNDLKESGMVIHIGGNMEFYGWEPKPVTREWPVTLIVDGRVALYGAPLPGSLDLPVYVISKTGDIIVSGGVLDFYGILYAPQGDVRFDGIDVEFIGSIVAQNFTKSGGKFKITYDEDIGRFLPKTRVHLIA